MGEEARRLDLRPLHGRTIDGYLSTMRALLDQERKAGQVKENPFEGLHVRVASAGESDRGFDSQEPAAIFGSPLVNGAKSSHFAYDPGTILINDWRFWAPLIALLSGARVAEIAQLSPGDVRQVENVWAIAITAEDDKRVKTVTSVRLVPVHQQLIALGLLELGSERRHAGHAKLLPEVPAQVRDDAGKQLSKWMLATLLPRFNFRKRSGLGFHSFRHSITTLLRNAGVLDRVNDRIKGQKSPGVGAMYGRHEMETLAKALNSIDLPPKIWSIPARKPSSAAFS